MRTVFPGELLLAVARRFLCAKVLCYFHLSLMLCPASRSPIPQNIFQIQSCTALDKQPNHLQGSARSRLMQRCRVRMPADRVVPVGISAGIQQHANDLNVAKL